MALFVTCVNDLVYPQTGKAVVTILERLGHRVEFPLAQTCCGQMHANSGYRAESLPLVRNYLAAFADYDAVVAPSGSCVAMVRDSYPRLVPDAAEVAGRTYELSEFLVDVLGVTDVGAAYPHRVTYHPTCHGLRILRLGDKCAAIRSTGAEVLAAADNSCLAHIGGGLTRHRDPVRAVHYAEILASEGDS